MYFNVCRGSTLATTKGIFVLRCVLFYSLYGCGQVIEYYRVARCRIGPSCKIAGLQNYKTKMLKDSNFEVGERLIPSSSSLQVYRNNEESQVEQMSRMSISGVLDSGEMSIRDDILYADPETIPRRLSPLSPVVSILSSPNRKSPIVLDSQQKSIAEALGVDYPSRVLHFSSAVSRRRSKSESPGRIGKFDIVGPLISTAPNQEIAKLLGCEELNAPKPRSPRAMVSLAAKNILQAPGLRNDYYSNLVSWSQRTRKVAVGLGSNVYWWGIDNKVESANLEHFDKTITAVSSHREHYLLVALEDGHILLINEITNRIVDTYRNPNGCFYCFKWKSNSKIFFAGDETGNISIFEINKTGLSLKGSYKCVQQQVCGIDVNDDFTELAVGGNNNICTLWEITKKMELTFKSNLPHEAAVKAISFCPWCKSLLATGSGSRDRKIRFWHTGSGTLLSVFDTKAQITSLAWSKSNRQLVATFGFGSINLLTVYQYPLMRIIKEVTGSPNLRILSSTFSPDNCSICVAANDSTIRVYEIWEGSLQLGTEGGRVLYGSSIIAFHEGVNRNVDLR